MRNGVYCLGAGEDEREGGAILFFGLKKPLDLTVKSREFPSPMLFVNQARKQNENVWIDIEKPFWWDVPTWLATAKPDSVGIAHNHMHRGGVLGSEAWGKARDTERFAGVKGNGWWTQEIYYHILNSGIRIPPSAGSASGVLPNPVGYNRVYVQLDGKPLNRENWFGALKDGRCFVTNGPLLRVKANQEWPGGSFQLDEELAVDLNIELTSNDPVRHVEVIQNGNVVKRIPCTNDTKQSLKADLEIREPGWFLVRAVADVDHTFRFASTAPWYINGNDGETHISQTSVQFFMDWIDERIAKVNKNLLNLNERESVLRWHIEAREFWEKRLTAANADLVSSPTETWQDARRRLSHLIEGFGNDAAVQKAKDDLADASNRTEFVESLEPLVWLTVSVNPESRVKIKSRLANVRLIENVPKQYLVRIENIAGITAPLNLSAVAPLTLRKVGGSPPTELSRRGSLRIRRWKQRDL